MYYERNDRVNSNVVPVVYGTFSALIFSRETFVIFASCFLSTSQAGPSAFSFNLDVGPKTILCQDGPGI